MFYGWIKTPLEPGGLFPTYQVFLQEKALIVLLLTVSSVSRDSELSTCTTVYRLIVCSCTFHVEMNNCSDPHHLSLLPAQRLAGNISFPSPSTASGELLLPVNTSPITTPGCRTLCWLSDRWLSAFPSLPPFAFLWKIVLGRMIFFPL